MSIVEAPVAHDDWLSDAGHLGFDGRDHRHRMSLRRLPPQEWLETDRRAQAQIALKAGLSATRRSEVILDPQTTAAEEGSIRLAQLLAADASLPVGADVEAGSPIERCGLMTQEDWCVMVREDTWRLRAASVHFPSRWVLADKAGATVAEIHGPVPGYEEQLGGLVEAFMDRLRPERPVWRVNWNLWDDPRLFQPVADPEAPRWPVPGPAAVGDRVFLRVERQTLRRICDDAVAFGIRVHQRRLGSIVDQPGALALLDGTLAGLGSSGSADKKLGRLRAPITSWVASQREDPDSSREGGTLVDEGCSQVTKAPRPGSKRSR